MSEKTGVLGAVCVVTLWVLCHSSGKDNESDLVSHVEGNLAIDLAPYG